jgi:regulatory protein YycI of two-component signal transduction system YycFG
MRKIRNRVANKSEEIVEKNWIKDNLVNIVLMIVNIVLVFISYLQAQSAKDAVRISEDNIRLIKEQFDIEKTTYLSINSVSQIIIDSITRNVTITFTT